MVACGMGAPVVALSVFVVAAARRPGYDQAADTISKLSAQGTAEPWLWTGGLLVYAVLMALFAVGLRRRFGSGGPARIMWGAMAVHAVLMAGVAGFGDDQRPGGFFTTEGAVHDVLSGMAFSALIVAMWGATALAKFDTALRSLRVVTFVVGAATLAVGMAFLFTPPEVQGIPQKIFVVLGAVWIVSLGARSLNPPPEKRNGGPSAACPA